MIVKNEADIVEASVRNLLYQCDQVIVADNLSDDGTREILYGLADEFDGRLIVVVDDEVGYWQSKKMTALAVRALELGHEWVVPADADEIWRPRMRNTTIGSVLDGVSRRAHLVGLAAAKVFNHYATVLDDQEEDDPVRRMEWRTADPLSLPKTAVKLWDGVVIAPGNHTATPPAGSPHAKSGLLQVRHFPYRSPEQFVTKAVTGAAAYAATDLPRDLGLHWKEYAEMVEAHGEEAGHDWFNRYFRYEHPDLAGRPGDPQPELGLARMIRNPARP